MKHCFIANALTPFSAKEHASVGQPFIQGLVGAVDARLRRSQTRRSMYDRNPNLQSTGQWLMPIFELCPHKALGPILLGGSRESTRQVMNAVGFPVETSRGQLDYFCDACLQVEYDPDDNVQFVGISDNPRITATFRDVDVFAVSATELFSLMAASDGSGEHQFSEYEYIFPNQIITLWDADEQYDRRQGERRQVWAQVGMGNDAYTSAISS
jgi:hypothetical protein